MHQIVLKNIYKYIKKDEVLSDINLVLESNKIYGFTGRNGSGKSMLLRLLSGLIKPSSGEILLNGQNWDGKPFTIGGTAKKHSIGVVIEHVDLYKDLTGIENLKYLAGFQGILSVKEIAAAMLRVGLEPDDKRAVKKYSLGMKQKLAIAQAIMEKPDFLYLDEPTNALDESGVELLHKLIKEEHQRGALVVIASHNQSDIELLCDHVIRLEKGKLISQYEN